MFYCHLNNRNGINNNGGITIAISPELNAVSIAVCSVKDKFCKKRGRHVAFHRMMNGIVKSDGNDDAVKIMAPDIVDSTTAWQIRRAIFRGLDLLWRRQQSKSAQE